MYNEKKTSVSVNAVLNVIKTCLSILFPLITFPYISRVLETDNVGKINFVSSVNSYFLLLAGLGISTYAIREGARIRNDKNKLENFVSQIFSINICSTILSYVILFVVLTCFSDLQGYRDLILVYSIQIIFTTFGVEWIYSIYEDYLYITIRVFMVQLISLIMMFMFVRNQGDYVKYAMVCVFSASAMYVFSFIHARKYCKFNFTLNIDWNKHLFPIMILFANSIAILLYVESDITMLGLLCGVHEVGLYSVSVKVYKIVKQAINAVVIVSIPRVSYYLAQGETERYYGLLSHIFKGIIILCLPIVLILIMLAPDVIDVLSGSIYLGATSSLRILCLAIIFSLVASFLANAILIPRRKEKIVLIATICSAVLNLVLNLCLIPLRGQNAAALTTLIAEAVTVLICIITLKNEVRKYKLNKTFINSVIASVVMILCILGLDYLTNSLVSFVRIIIIAPICFGIYSSCLFIIKDETVCFIINLIINKLRKYQGNFS